MAYPYGGYRYGGGTTGYGGYQGYGYGYPGYETQGGGSMLGGDLIQGSTLATTEPLGYTNAPKSSKSVTQLYNEAIAPPKRKKKRGFFKSLIKGISDFFVGVGNGFMKLVKSLADPKTWLIIVAAAILSWLVPGVGMALLIAGIAMASAQIGKGIASGDMKQVGEGSFNLALCGVGGGGAKSAGTAGVKAGKGAEAATFSVSGTKVAKAKATLAAAEKSKDAAAIAKAQEGLKIAELAQARAAVAPMTSSQRAAHLAATGVNKVDDIAPALNSAKTTAKNANKKVELAKRDAKLAKKNGDDAQISKANENLAAWETTAIQAAQKVQDIRMAQRILEVKNMTRIQRMKAGAVDKWRGGKDSLAMVGGKTLTSADGRTTKLPKFKTKPLEITPAAESAAKMSTKVAAQSEKAAAAAAKTKEAAAATKAKNPTPPQKPPKPKVETPVAKTPSRISQVTTTKARQARQSISNKAGQFGSYVKTSNVGQAAGRTGAAAGRQAGRAKQYVSGKNTQFKTWAGNTKLVRSAKGAYKTAAESKLANSKVGLGAKHVWNNKYTYSGQLNTVNNTLGAAWDKSNLPGANGQYHLLKMMG